MNHSLRAQLRQELPDWHKQPLYLTVGEIENPLSVLESYFDCYDLPAARACLKEWLDEGLRAEDTDGASLVHTHMMINRLVEANWLIFQQKLPLAKVTNVFGENNLGAIVSLIVAAVAPERIYLLNKEPIDLLIVIREEIQRPFKEYEHIIEMTGLNYDPIYFSLHKSMDLRRRLEEGHIFYTASCLPEKLVYDNGLSPALPTNPINTEKLKAEATKYFGAGMKRASAFLNAAQYHQLRGENELCAFMLHQVSELSLRAFLRAMTGQDIRTHEIAVLLKHTNRFAPAIAMIIQESGEQEDQNLHLLEKAYKNARYSDDFILSAQEVQMLLGTVTQLLQKIEAAFVEKMNALNNLEQK
jgi:HEPN domain-containing protein